MITIYYGEDTVKSRKDFIDKKLTYEESLVLSGAAMTLTDLIQVFEGGDLFATEKHVFIEDFFGKKKAGKETTTFIDIVNQHQLDVDIHLWEGKELTAHQLKQFPKAITKQYKLPQTLFVFLDAIKPNNTPQLIKFFHQALSDQDVSLLFAMIIRQFRIFLALQEQSKHAIEEINRMAPWQITKLQKQAHLFDKKTLQKHYTHLFEIEKGMKTGTLSMPLEQIIDFFLLQL